MQAEFVYAATYTSVASTYSFNAALCAVKNIMRLWRLLLPLSPPPSRCWFKLSKNLRTARSSATPGGRAGAPAPHSGLKACKPLTVYTACHVSYSGTLNTKTLDTHSSGQTGAPAPYSGLKACKP